MSQNAKQKDKEEKSKRERMKELSREVPARKYKSHARITKWDQEALPHFMVQIHHMELGVKFRNSSSSGYRVAGLLHQAQRELSGSGELC